MNLLGNDIAEVVHLLTKKLGVDLNDLSVALYNDAGDVPFIYQLLDFFHELFGLRLEFIFSSIISRYFLLSILFQT